jgi:hypothetical protein
MTLLDCLTVCYQRGVRLVIEDGRLRAQGKPGAVNDALRDGLVTHKREIVAAFGNGVFPDSTLPDVIKIPGWCPNSETALKSCVDSQRLTRAV